MAPDPERDAVATRAIFGLILALLPWAVLGFLMSR